MTETLKTVKFQTELTISSTGSGWHFLLVDGEIEKKLGFEGKFKRIVCSINGGEGFQCALMPWGEMFYIIVNKKKRDEAGIVAGDMVDIVLEKDESKYGLPMPEEFAEVLRQDTEGDKLFHNLSEGKQRSLLYHIGKVNNIDARIHAGLIIVEHIKENGGKVVDKKLYEELKRPVF